MIKSESITNLIPALVSAKQKFGTINKNKSGYGYKYATIDEILDKIEGHLLEVGLTVIHDRDIDKMELTSYVYHVSGEYIATKIKLDVELSNKMNYMQNLGSASTYAIRYNLIALFNLCAEEDDDGVASNKPKQPQEVKKLKEAPSPTPIEQEIQQIIPFIAKFGLKDQVNKLCGLVVKNWTEENVNQIKQLILDKRKENESNY
jgi:hypothetical protein